MQPVAMVLVMLQARCLLAEISFRIWVPLVTTNANEAIGLDLSKEPAVARAENAGRRFDSHRAGFAAPDSLKRSAFMRAARGLSEQSLPFTPGRREHVPLSLLVQHRPADHY